MYQGPVESLVPYLQTFNLHCPKYHNSADFGDLFASRLARRKSFHILELTIIPVNVYPHIQQWM